MRIVLDPGHGGRDPGACANGLQEAKINLKLATYLKTELLMRKTEVFLTRKADVYLSLKDRVKLSNSANPNLFLSLHCNAAINHLANGIETLCYSRASKGYLYALSVQNSLSRGTELTNRGVKIRSDLYVLRNTKAPAILLELGFISNKEDAIWLAKTKHLKKAASLVAHGIGNQIA